MMSGRLDLLRQHGAELAMLLMTVIWGIHYVVVKDALSDLPPLTFNAIRFSLGLPVLLLITARSRARLHIDRRDIPRLLLLGLIGPFGYQIFFILGLERTTSTNTALLSSTMPTWTALLTLALGIVIVRRQLIFGVVMSLVGVVLVVLGRSGAEVSLSTTDLIGSTLALGGAIVVALYNIAIKPLIDRYGSGTIAVWTYIISNAGLIIAASPDLVTLTPGDLPVKVWPHLFYSGVLSCALGFLVENYALRAIGPSRTAIYYNFMPLIAAAAGVLALSEPLTVPLVLGGALTMVGMLIVRQNTYLRLPPKAVSTVPHTGRTREMARADQS